ncbi:hypothetical protein niasHT_030143 [Heterodera trifolii]|uniref:Protein kinase domain-containing protein n=1 Tax=Heterodera trifolii TaxID=157864 RepID=A0ABD2KIB2_9BILA
MYVKKVGEDETLKLIDYDGATFIPVGLFENPRKLANKVVPREFYVATPTYAAIEYYENMTISTKMDMWALGIIIYELILVQANFNERISEVCVKGKNHANTAGNWQHLLGHAKKQQRSETIG